MDGWREGGREGFKNHAKPRYELCFFFIFVFSFFCFILFCSPMHRYRQSFHPATMTTRAVVGAEATWLQLGTTGTHKTAWTTPST